jgi:dienelactone hydrolase
MMNELPFIRRQRTGNKARHMMERVQPGEPVMQPPFSSRIALCGLSALFGLALTASLAKAQNLTLPRGDGAITPVKLYGPGSGCPRTMIFSHGLGGSDDGAAGFADHMAGQGWRIIVMGHAESGRGALRGALMSGDVRGQLKEKASDPALHRARMLDLEAAVTLALRDCRPPQLVLAGHSMGAATTMIEAGATARFGRMGANRFDAYVALSPQGNGYMFAAGAWSKVAKPVLMITGTRDEGADGDWRTRLSAFEGLPPGRKRLAIIPGATHLQLSGGERQMGSMLGALTEEFLALPISGRRAPSAIGGVETRDK